MASNDITKFVDGNGDEFNFRDPSKESLDNKVTSIRASSSASDDKYPSEKAVASAIEALDVSSVGGAGKYISAISESDGKISATETTMDTTPTANSTNAVTSGGVKTALDGKVNATAAAAGTIQEIIQALRVIPGGSIGSVQASQSTIGGITIPAAWYNYEWLPHRRGQPFDDNQNYGTLIITPLTGTPDVYLIEGQNLHTESPTYRAKRLADYSHTHGNIQTSGALQTSDITIATGDKLVVTDASDSHKVARASISFDTGVSQTVLKRNGTFESVREADLAWGGVFTTSKAPVENFALQNVFFGPKPSAISVEYSNNRTSDNPTWTDYGLTDTQKKALLSGTINTGVYCGKKIHCHPGYTGNAEYKDLSNENIADQGLRITICCRSLTNRTADTDNWVYCYLRRILMNMSAQSASGGAHCVVEKQNGTQYKENSDTWTTLGDYKIQGNSGWNSIPFDGAFGGGWTQTSNYSWVIRFTIWSDTLSANPNSGQTGCLMIQRIAALSSNVWTANGDNPTMQMYGTPYSTNEVGGAKFGAIQFTARTIRTNLASTSTASFDGTANITPGVTGTLPVSNGGTGKASVTANSYLKGNGTSALVERTYAEVRTDLGISAGANKVEASSTPGDGTIKIDGTSTTVYTHPTNGANTSKGDTTDQTPSFGHTFKALSATVDSQGHTTALAEHTVTIPDTVVTGGNSGEAGLMSPADKDKVDALGTASTKDVPASGNASSTQVVMGNDSRLTDSRTPTAHSHNTDANEVTDSTAASGLAVVTDTTEIVTTNTDGYSSNDKKLYRRPIKSKLWPWIKGLLSSESGVNISGSSASCTGNAATATSADTATTATRLGGTRVIENETDTRIKLVNVATLGSYTWIKWQCLITVENAGGYGNKGTSITLLAKGDAQGQTRYNHTLTILSSNNWNLSRYRPMIWNVANGDGIDAMFGVWDAVDNHLETYSEIRVTVTILAGSVQGATFPLTHDAGSWSSSTAYLTTFASSSCTEIVDYGRADVPSDTDKTVRIGWNKSAVPVVTPGSTYEYNAGQTVSGTAYLVAAYGYDGVGYYKDVEAVNVTVGNSQKWNGYSLVVGSASSSPAANTLYIF